MSYKIQTTSRFDKEAKYLKRKYPSLKAELKSLIEELEENPFIGTDIGNNVRKIRMAVQSKGKGKRGGARVMTYIKIVDESLYLFSIYSKGEQDSISEKKIQELIKDI
jgi:mRNA-degrading endonuclease RelE of RelBE toxin-antitoxin system